MVASCFRKLPELYHEGRLLSHAEIMHGDGRTQWSSKHIHSRYSSHDLSAKLIVHVCVAALADKSCH